MKTPRSLFILTLLALLLPLHATTYYVASTSATPAGSDSNSGLDAAHPWATWDHAIDNMTCGDTLVNFAETRASGHLIEGGKNIASQFAGCLGVTNFVSSALASLPPPTVELAGINWSTVPPTVTAWNRDGRRVDPTIDDANLAKISLATRLDIRLNAYGAWGQGTYCGVDCFRVSAITAITGGSSDTLEVFGSVPNLAVGSIVEFSLDGSGYFPAANIMSGLTYQQWYYVVNCSGCDTSGGTIKISATAGGSPITGMTCTGSWPNGCSLPVSSVSVFMSVVPTVTVGSCTITLTDTPSGWSNNMPVTMGVNGGLLHLGTMPTPFAAETIYYVRDLSGRSFCLSATPGGTAINFTANGIGPMAFSPANPSVKLAFRGLDFIATSYIFTMMNFGSATEQATTVGLVDGIELDRVVIEPADLTVASQQRGVNDQGSHFFAHDSYFRGFSNGEAQAIAGIGAVGPTAIINNTLEGAGESILYGGGNPGNAAILYSKLIQNNYGFKPPTWRYTYAVETPTGTGWYSAYDPALAGGEWGCKVVNNTWTINSGTLVSVVVSGNIVTVTTSSDHNLHPGNTVTFSGASTPNLNNIFGIDSTPTSTTFTFTGYSTAVIPNGTYTNAGLAFTTNRVRDRDCGQGGQWYRVGSNGLWATTGLTPPAYGNPSIKTCLEHKNGSYIKYTGNICQYNWEGDNGLQQGQSFNTSAEAPNGGNMSDDHVDIQYNASYNIFMPYTKIPLCGRVLVITCATPPGSFTFSNNLHVMDANACGHTWAVSEPCIAPAVLLNQGGNGDGTVPSINAQPNQGEVVSYNTIYVPDSGITPPITLMTNSSPNGGPFSEYGPTNTNESYDSNILAGDFTGDNAGANTNLAVSGYFMNSTFNRTVMKGASGSYNNVGATNTFTNYSFPANNAAIKYVNATGDITGDYSLDPTSNYSAEGGCVIFCASNGANVGADIDMVKMLTSGAISGYPTWDVRYLNTITPTSTTLQFSLYGSTNYTVSLYSAISRTTGVRVAQQTCTISGGACSTTFTGLTPNTQYYVKMTDGTVTMVFPRPGVSEVMTTTSPVGGSVTTGATKHSGATILH